MAILLAAWVAAGAAPGPDTIPSLRGQFDAALTQAQNEYDRQIAALPSGYLQMLDAREADRRKTGDLEAVVALRKERTHFMATTNVMIGDARMEQGGVLALKRHYLRQMTLAAERRDDLIAAAAQTYTNHLEALKLQFIRAGKKPDARLVQDELLSVLDDPRVRAATLSAYARRPAGTDALTTNSQAQAGEVPAAEATDPERVLDESVVSFRFTDSDLASPADLLGRLAQRCMNRGLRFRVAASRLNVKSFTVEDGTPRFVLTPTRPPAGPRPRSRSFVFNGVPLRVVIQTFGAAMGVAYRADRDTKELILLDAGDPRSTWTPDLLPVDQIATALQSFDSRRQHIGRSVLVTADVVSTMQGVGSLILNLRNGMRLYLPPTTANHAAYERIRTALTGDNTRGREGIEITALATVHPESSAQGLVLGDAALLEVGVGRNYSVPASSETTLSTGRAIRRIDEGLKARP